MNEVKCMWHEISREQRKTELLRDGETSGVANYEKRGCYECDGKRTDCDMYEILETERSKTR
jgi:hypothetical protein